MRDEKLYHYMKELMDTEDIFIEPSSCAAFEGPARLCRDAASRAFLDRMELTGRLDAGTHIVWATGGSLVPEAVRQEYRQKAQQA